MWSAEGNKERGNFDQEILYKDLSEKEEKIKNLTFQIEELKKENEKLKKKQVFIFRAPTLKN